LRQADERQSSFPIPILVGPTGVGKSEIACHLARRWNAEILSADAFQVFRGMEIGTAQPPGEWLEKIPHHLIGCRPLEEVWNAVEFAKEAAKIIRDRAGHGKKLIMVGGAGFYIKALVDGPPPGKAPSPEIRAMVLERVREMGAARAREWLESRDSQAALRIHPNDLRRLCRALEKTFSAESKTIFFEPLGRKNTRFVGVERSRENLDRLLRSRVEWIWNNGLLRETAAMLEAHLPPDHSTWGAIGYSEATAFLQGKMMREEAVEKMFRRTRQYAKRQWTWFKHQHAVDWIDLDQVSDIFSAVDMVERMFQTDGREL
jgi:tRNA dimethylallyltransferase